MTSQQFTAQLQEASQRCGLGDSLTGTQALVRVSWSQGCFNPSGNYTNAVDQAAATATGYTSLQIAELYTDVIQAATANNSTASLTQVVYPSFGLNSTTNPYPDGVAPSTSGATCDYGNAQADSTYSLIALCISGCFHPSSQFLLYQGKAAQPEKFDVAEAKLQSVESVYHLSKSQSLYVAGIDPFFQQPVWLNIPNAKSWVADGNLIIPGKTQIFYGFYGENLALPKVTEEHPMAVRDEQGKDYVVSAENLAELLDGKQVFSVRREAGNFVTLTGYRKTHEAAPAYNPLVSIAHDFIYATGEAGSVSDAVASGAGQWQNVYTKHNLSEVNDANRLLEIISNNVDF